MKLFKTQNFVIVSVHCIYAQRIGGNLKSHFKIVKNYTYQLWCKEMPLWNP